MEGYSLADTYWFVSAAGNRSARTGGKYTVVTKPISPMNMVSLRCASYVMNGFSEPTDGKRIAKTTSTYQNICRSNVTPSCVMVSWLLLDTVRFVWATKACRLSDGCVSTKTGIPGWIMSTD